MKAKIYVTVVITFFLIVGFKGFGQANTSLSNLVSPTKINQSLVPGKTNNINLGSGSIDWKNLYLSGVIYLHGKPAFYTPLDSNTFVGYNAGSTGVTGKNNTGIGYLALKNITSGNYNTALGYQSLYSTTTGSYNTATGNISLYKNTTGAFNTAYGYGALYNNTTGSANTATGNSALENITTGSNNTATGNFASFSNTTGSYNTADGNFALGSNTTGSYNVANGDEVLHASSGSNNTGTGAEAFFQNTTGSNNTATGYGALYNNTSGSYNTAAGEYALTSNQTGIGNTGLGHYADVSGTVSYATAIGNDATVNASNKMQLGSSTTVLATSNGYTIVSDGRFKEQIKDNDVPGLAFINKLRPVTYNFNYKKFDDFTRKNTKNDSAVKNDKEYQSQLVEKAKKRELGFIAQEVDKTVRDNNYTFTGVYTPQNDNDNYALDYGRFVVPLVKAVQELSAKNDSLQNQINELKAMITSSQSTTQQAIAVASASLSQNVPNPFSSSTSISYTLPRNYQSAKILVMDNNGIALKQINLNAKGSGNVMLDASTLASGAYSYSLYVDGKLIDTKKMVLSK